MDRNHLHTPEWCAEELTQSIAEWVGGGANRESARDAVRFLYEDAVRYRAWRDAMLADDQSARDVVEASLQEAMTNDRKPTAAEWDAAWDNVIKGSL